MKKRATGAKPVALSAHIDVIDLDIDVRFDRMPQSVALDPFPATCNAGTCSAASAVQ
jgi:hypothetical protein